jgi:hypothetical protein
MAKSIRYCVRGRLGKTVYKVVGGLVRKVHEARGEDLHDSIFDAIHHGAKALQAWRMKPQGFSFDIHKIEREEP